MKTNTGHFRLTPGVWQRVLETIDVSVASIRNACAVYVGAGCRPGETACLFGFSSASSTSTFYVRIPRRREVWSSSFLQEVRAAIPAGGNEEARALAAACTYLLRERRAEYPELACDESGRWHAAGLDGQVYDPVQKNGKRPILTPRSGIFKTLAHCAELHRADVELTAEYVRLLSSRDAKVQTELLQVVQQMEPRLVGTMMSEVFNR